MKPKQINLVVAIPREDASRYYKNLTAHKDLNLQIVTDASAALEALTDRDPKIDMLVLSQTLTNAYALVEEVRETHPRLLIVLVDEQADFALPGQADEISTEPFSNDDLVRRINRLMSDRQLDTLRADTMPAVREFAKHLRTAVGDYGKADAAVSALRALGFDYVAFYRIESLAPMTITLKLQQGETNLQMGAPAEATANDIIGVVAKSGQSRSAGPQDTVSHPLVQRGRLSAVTCVPVGMTTRYGVLVCGKLANAFTQEQVLAMELISAQFAASISKDAG
jgi:DNA-binding NarL/FixJ family response regulator